MGGPVSRIGALLRVAFVLAISAFVGAYGVAAVLFPSMPSVNEGGIRVSLGVAIALAVAFFWTVLRIRAGLGAVDMRVPADPLNRSVVIFISAAIGYVIGTTVFR
jgi:hypothetical protein